MWTINSIMTSTVAGLVWHKQNCVFFLTISTFGKTDLASCALTTSRRCAPLSTYTTCHKAASTFKRHPCEWSSSHELINLTTQKHHSCGLLLPRNKSIDSSVTWCCSCSAVYLNGLIVSMINGRNDEDNPWEMTDVTTSRPRVYHALLSWRAG